MKKLIAYLRTHTFSKLILAFIATLTSSLLVLSGFSYSAYRTSLLEDAVDSSHTSVSFIMERLDGEIKTLHYAALSVLNNTTLKNFDSYHKDLSTDSLFQMKDMKKEIAYVENSCLPLENLWLYSSKEDLFITRYGGFSRQDFFKKQIALQRLSGTDFEEALSTAGPFRYITTSNFKSYYDSACILTFFRSITDYQNNVTGQMILNVRRSTFTDILDKAGLRKELTVFLLDETGELICASENASALTDRVENALQQLSDTDGTETELTLNGGAYTGWITRSSESGLRYMALIDQQELLRDVTHIRLVTLGLAVICILASAILAVCFTSQMFAPIRKIVRYIQAEQGENSGYKDVFLIESFIDYMKSQNRQLQESIDSYALLMQESALTELLYSREQPMLELYRKANLLPAFPYDFFTVAILSLAPDRGNFGEQADALSGREPFSSQLCLKKVCQSERLILILNLRTEEEKLVHDFLEAFKQETECPDLLYAYGKIHQTRSGIYDSFHQALNLLMVKPTAHGSDKEAYKEALNASYITSFYPQELELKLIRQMKSRDFDDGPKTLLYSLFEKNSQGSDAALRLESLFIQLIMTANRILAEAQLDGAALFGKDVNQYRTLERLSAAEEKEQYILNLFQKLSVHIRSSRTGKTAEIYQWMLEYVKEHYKEDLSLNELSYQLQLSPSYLSSIFKEYHHDTFLEYLNRYRIAQAKPLLLQTEESVTSVAQQVGYTNVNTFIRIFKKEEGVTPGQFRTK